MPNPDGGISPLAASDVTYDTTYDIASSAQLAVAPRGDLPGPWYLTNMGPNTVYLGPTGVTSGTGTAVGSGSKSAAIPVSGTVTFVVCAPGNQSSFHITNS
jgi:hypothetical protein